ncbi:helix-turn-helix domain-containing protein [Micromonospora sp. NPDC005163]
MWRCIIALSLLVNRQSSASLGQRPLAGLAAARARGRTGGRKPKMTPALINKAQRMYGSKQFTMAEIAASCGVTPTTIYRNIRADTAERPTTATASTAAPRGGPR